MNFLALLIPGVFLGVGFWMLARAGRGKRALHPQLAALVVVEGVLLLIVCIVGLAT